MNNILEFCLTIDAILIMFAYLGVIVIEMTKVEIWFKKENTNEEK